MTRVDEATLPEPIRNRLAEIRACNNVESVTVQATSDLGTLVLIVPKDHVGEGGGWAMPTEPHTMLIPNRRH